MVGVILRNYPSEVSAIICYFMLESINVNRSYLRRYALFGFFRPPPVVPVFF